jgi:hypothetical protein
MAVIRCIQDPIHSTKWISCFIALIVYYFGIFLYGVLPVLRFRMAFSHLSFLNRLTRIGFVIAMGFKFLGDIGAVLIGNSIEGDFNFWFAGLFCCELPSYAIASCYSCVLLFWLSVCTEVLPGRYGKGFRIMKVVVIGFNVVAYLVFITTAVLFHDPHIVDHSFNGIAALCRDFVLGVIFIVFMITLRIGLKEDLQAGETLDERKLVRFTVILSVLLLLRGGVSLIQGFVFTTESMECGSGFLSLVMVCELLFEGVPFLFLIHVNNDFLATESENDLQRQKMIVPSPLIDDDFS